MWILIFSPYRLEDSPVVDSSHSTAPNRKASDSRREPGASSTKKFRMKDVSHLEDPLATLGYCRTLLFSCLQPAMLLLFLAAAVRHTGQRELVPNNVHKIEWLFRPPLTLTGGYSWSYNSQLFVEEYYPDVNPGLWLAMDSIIGGCFGVFFGGWFSDFAIRRMGLYARLWILAACLVGAATQCWPCAWTRSPSCRPWPLRSQLASCFGSLTACSTCYSFITSSVSSSLSLCANVDVRAVKAPWAISAETWFSVLFTVIVELVPAPVRAVVTGIFLFGMDNIGGNLPVVVDPVSERYDYRTALLIFFPGFVGASK